MSSSPEGSRERFKPLPRRREFWKNLPDLVRNGIVVLPNDPAEIEDARNAAQSIIIDYIEKELITNFSRPQLDPTKDVYEEYFVKYTDLITVIEHRVWESIGEEVANQTATHPEAPFDERAAAYMTLISLGLNEPPQSQELYMNIALFSRVYEEKLKEKYGAKYRPEILYEALQRNLPTFLLRFISMDSVISFLASINFATKETQSDGLILRPDVRYDIRFFELDPNDALHLSNKFIDVIHEHAEKNAITEDQVGRTEDRGCPVLYSKERNTILKFAVGEMVEQLRTRETLQR